MSKYITVLFFFILLTIYYEKYIICTIMVFYCGINVNG